MSLIVCAVGFPVAAWGQGSRPSIESRQLEDPRAVAPGPTLEEPQENLPERSVGVAIPDKRIILQALDKVTARVTKIEAEIGRPIRFGTLDIVVHTCNKRPPEESPETSAFLEITEIRENEEAATLFIGWMFASSPALSALEHPVYDVWVLDCLDKD
ncbi:MAG: DUF2155 domain-containing protein [Rhodospirillales bacterium]|nr:DUF2155 domain-containing protein [Rhodospirillales bacterium]